VPGVIAELLEELRIVIWSEWSATAPESGSRRRPDPTEDHPDQPAYQRDENHEEKPDVLRKSPRLSARSAQHVEDEVDVQRDADEHSEDPQHIYYRSRVPDEASSVRSALAILVYTALRVALFAIVWVALELFSPVHGLWAAVAAILVSGAISIIVLDRQRGAVGLVVAGFFGRLNARIEASTRAEDVDPAIDTPPAGSGQGEQQTETDPVDEQQQPGVLESGDQGTTAGAADDHS
jgi:hypothetical protein